MEVIAYPMVGVLLIGVFAWLDKIHWQLGNIENNAERLFIIYSHMSESMIEIGRRSRKQDRGVEVTSPSAEFNARVEAAVRRWTEL